MGKLILTVCLVTLLSCGAAFARNSDFIEFQQILDTKCSQCHPRARIEQAIERGENFEEIITKMIRLGAKLSSHEQQVLGVFWRSEESDSVKASAAVASQDPLGEFRAVLESRCTGCHSLERIEAAMAQGQSLDDLVEMMRKRGAIVTEADAKALAPFWGSPYKEK